MIYNETIFSHIAQVTHNITSMYSISQYKNYIVANSERLRLKLHKCALGKAFHHAFLAAWFMAKNSIVNSNPMLSFDKRINNSDGTK